MLLAAATGVSGGAPEPRHERVILVNSSGVKILPIPAAESATPDVTFEFSGDLRYREIRIYNPRSALAPFGRRIGRHVGSIVPPHIVEQFRTAIEQARTEGRAVIFRCEHPAGVWQRASVIAPTPDCVIVSVKQVK